jgi:hypothetical protein
MLALGESCFLYLKCQRIIRGGEPSFHGRLFLLTVEWTFPTALCIVYAHLLSPLNAYVRHVDLHSVIRGCPNVPPLT